MGSKTARAFRRWSSYDIAPDDRRFLMIKQLATHDEGSARIVVVRNWVEELKRIVN
jgi:hypothetical protein